jgi:hypothetical protein
LGTVVEKRGKMRKPKYADVNPLTKLHPDEPWFFIRAQDKLSIDAVRHYSHLLEEESKKALGRGEDALSQSLMADSIQVIGFAHKFLDWQEEHPEFVKLPD